MGAKAGPIGVEIIDPFGLVDALIESRLLSERNCEDKIKVAAVSGKSWKNS